MKLNLSYIFPSFNDDVYYLPIYSSILTINSYVICTYKLVLAGAGYTLQTESRFLFFEMPPSNSCAQRLKIMQHSSVFISWAAARNLPPWHDGYAWISSKIIIKVIPIFDYKITKITENKVPRQFILHYKSIIQSKNYIKFYIWRLRRRIYIIIGFGFSIITFFSSFYQAGETVP